MEDRVVNPNLNLEDNGEETLRPKYLKEYIGQGDVKDIISIYIKAALMRKEVLDHILIYGPPGLGKTTLAQVIANEMGSKLVVTSGPVIERQGDLAAILSTLEEGDILFIDEIHRIPSFVEEILYSAMEDYELDILVGKDYSSKSVRIELPPFTLIGATTRFGDLSSPLRDRFGVVEKLEFYSIDDINKIINRTSRIYDYKISKEASLELASRSRGTPRIANRLFRRIRDFAYVANLEEINLDITKEALDKLKIDKLGLDKSDYNYLYGIIEKFNGGPVGIDALAASIGEEANTILDVYEPYLLQEGYIKRTSRGRVATEKAYLHLDIKYNKGIF